MDFNWPAKLVYLLPKLSRLTSRTWLGILVCACLLSCGCDSKPVANDSEGGESAANTPSDSAGKKFEPNGSKSVAPAIPAKPPEPDINDAQFHPVIKAAAEGYLRFAMVNTTAAESPGPKLAPTLCMAAPSRMSENPSAKMSQANSASGHGQKLYFLFAKDIGHYLNRDGTDSPVGQVLVKESWTAVPGNSDARNLRSHASGNRVNPRLTVDGKTLKLGKRKNLFVMIKQDPETEGTDQGWVYGVIDPNSYEIKSAGAVASCIACHEGEDDRLFRDGIIDQSKYPYTDGMNVSPKHNQPAKPPADSKASE